MCITEVTKAEQEQEESWPEKREKSTKSKTTQKGKHSAAERRNESKTIRVPKQKLLIKKFNTNIKQKRDDAK